MADGSKSPGTAARWSDLGRRTLSAALLAPLALACIWYGQAPYVALIGLACLGLAVEWVRLCGAAPARWPGAVVPIVVVLSLFASLGGVWTGLLVLLAGSLLILALMGAAGRVAQGVGALYIGVPAIALLWLRFGSDTGRANVLLLVLVVWASDIGAYVVGRLLGGPKLAPRLSPGKTWSGAIGGLAAAIVVGQVAAVLLEASPLGRAALLAAALGVATQAGDLLESGIKRHFGVKDSGWLIPGHGGLLDRLDGLLAAAPVAALAVVLGRGELL